MNFFEIGLSFAEGLALIASPCILPVLPLVLGASVDGGKRRPFGIIAGFVLAFTAFAMASRKLVGLLGIDLQTIQYVSLLLLAGFGLILISETLSEKFSRVTAGFADSGSRLSAGGRGGFFSGIFIGMLIGLIWTPCAGPILAAVLVQIIRQESDIQALFMVGAFALGAGIPMLIIALTGRKVMSKLGFFTKHAEVVRKLFGVVILIAVGFIASGTDAQSLFKKNNTEVSSSSAGLINALETPYAAPEFTGIEKWLNSEPLTMAGLRGKVVLIDFWTYSCINCVRTLPYITKWDRDYRSKGLVIIGVHAPEFEFEKDIGNVSKAITKHNIQYPIAIDNKLDTWAAFKNRYWPAHYLIDKEGKVVYTHFGEGNYAQTENNIRHLLGLGNKADMEAEKLVFSKGQTPETYLGYGRAENFLSPEKLVSGNFTLPKFLTSDKWALSGKWEVDAEHITAAESGAKLQLNFTAAKVFLVLGTRDGKPVKAKITLNGEPLGKAAGIDAPEGIITVDNHTLYELINQDSVRNGLLEITAEPGLQAYAFTFGS